MQKRRFETRFRETVITNRVLTQNEAKRNLHKKNIVMALDLEKQ